MSKTVGIIVTLLTAAAYFYYNFNYFNFVRKQKQMQQNRLGIVTLFFVLNYLIFMILSTLEIHLIMNWLCFAVLLFGETLIYSKGDRQCALLSTFTGIIYGLAINIFCRSTLSIITGESLQNFDNHIYSDQNLKAVPVFMGFILTGFAIQILSQPHFQERLQLIMKYHRQTFLLEMLTGMFFYLFLNLLIYSTPTNDLTLKAWSIESSLFSMIGFFIAIRYTWRICILADYREKNQSMEQELEVQQQEEPYLLQKAIRDPLTGLYNRQHALDVIAAMLRKKSSITLCFIDMDGLKEMNDRYGHAEGDRYIRSVTGQLQHACRSEEDMLFRYGGDEFLLLFPEAPVDIIEGRMEESLRILAERGKAERFAIPLSFSYGVIDGQEFSDAEELIRTADQKMYAQKKAKQRARN